MKKEYRILAIVYTVLSVIALIPLGMLQFFSVFLFDAGWSRVAVFISVGILLIPVILIAGNISVWLFARKGRLIGMLVSMAVPIVYPILFFSFSGIAF